MCPESPLRVLVTIDVAEWRDIGKLQHGVLRLSLSYYSRERFNPACNRAPLLLVSNFELCVTVVDKGD